MRAIKLIKNAERKVRETRSKIKAATGRDSSSQGVRAWVVEFKNTRRGEPLIAFDNLFKDALVFRRPHVSITEQTQAKLVLSPGDYSQRSLLHRYEHELDRLGGNEI